LLKTTANVFSSLSKHAARFVMKNCGECCGSTKLTVACQSPSNICILF